MRGKKKVYKLLRPFGILLAFTFAVLKLVVVTDIAQYIEIGKPLIIAEMSGTSKSLPWGYFQFPKLTFNLDGDIVCTVAFKSDSVAAYDGDYLYYISSDDGKSWHQSVEPQIDCSLMMNNGCYFQGPILENSYESGIELKYTPVINSEKKEIALYYGDEVSTHDYPRSFECQEYDPVKGITENFSSSFIWPHYPIWTRNGLTCTPGRPFYPFRMHTPGMIVQEEDGSLFAAVGSVGFDAETGALPNNVFRNIYCFRSENNARTWEYISQILTQPEYCDDSKDGFNEPNVMITSSDAYFIVMRTGSNSPSYCAWSYDQGKTWKDLSVFAECGVDPQLLKLDCGATLASFGRPGINIKTSFDDSCREWSHLMKIDESGIERSDGAEKATCGYSSMVPLGDDTALIAYSEFDYPEGKKAGKVVKRILVRQLRIKEY